ncbi:MAG: TlpA family protein disulfide reductase [Dehalococcoidia bacterium]|nr:TlpA family protein disulfide reductase [Dehalococcoidia bacterium]
MRDASPASPEGDKRGNLKRTLIILAALVPLAVFFGMLAWGVGWSENRIGRPGINTSFGDASLDPEPAPLFEGVTLDGDSLSLASLKGQVVVLDFWSSWCPPCRNEAPGLAEVYAEYRDEGVEFLGMALWDTEENVRDFVEELDVPYPNLLDDRGSIAIDYGVVKIPEKFFIDREGNLVRVFSGPTDPDDMREALDIILEGP